MLTDVPITVKPKTLSKSDSTEQFKKERSCDYRARVEGIICCNKLPGLAPLVQRQRDNYYCGRMRRSRRSHDNAVEQCTIPPITKGKQRETGAGVHCPIDVACHCGAHDCGRTRDLG